MRMSRAFSAPDSFWDHEPRALPWAGMNDAFGVSESESSALVRRVPSRGRPTVGPPRARQPAIGWGEILTSAR
jgi:hypothetical protein